MKPGADNFTPEEQHWYDYSMKVILYPEQIHRDEWELINTLRDLYYGRSSIPAFELRDLLTVNQNCLNKQNIYFTRYAFCLDFPVTDIVFALRKRIENIILLSFRGVEDGIFPFVGSKIRNGANRIAEEGIVGDEAWYWLKVLIIVTLQRYNFPLVVEDHAALYSYAEAKAAVPLSVMFWGKIPSEFYYIIAEKTGLEGEELEDEIDKVVYEVTAPLVLGNWIEWQYALQAERNEKNARFRMYFFMAMAAIIVLPTAYLAFKSALSVWAHVEGWQIGLFAKFKLALTAFTDVMGAGFSAFLTTINYDTLVGVHKIAELVSKDYRAIMSKVYGEITRVSEALGYGPYTLLLLTQNSKKLVQDVSSTFGMEWDLCEVQWLSNFQSYMTKFSGAAYKYRDNPEALLYDLSRWVERDALNAKGAFMAGLVQNVNEVVKDVENFVGDLVTIREDINALVMDLPEKISKQISDAIDPYVSQFDDFIVDTYDPYRRDINRLIDSVQSHQAEIKIRADELIERLKKPADYLLEIDNLSDEDREDQEVKLDDISSRYYKKELTGMIEALQPIDAELRKITKVLTRPLELLSWGTKEIEEPVKKPIGEIDKARTWYVGDY